MEFDVFESFIPLKPVLRGLDIVAPFITVKEPSEIKPRLKRQRKKSKCYFGTGSDKCHRRCLSVRGALVHIKRQRKKHKYAFQTLTRR